MSSWVRLDDGFFRNPKVLRAGRDARDLYLVGLCYCGAGLTDGVIPSTAIRVLGAEAEIDDARGAAARLVDVGLWEQDGDDYRVHDYLEHQPSKERVLQTREARAVAGSKGGRARAENAAAIVKQNPSKLLSKIQAKAKQNSSTTRNVNERVASEEATRPPQPPLESTGGIVLEVATRAPNESHQLFAIFCDLTTVDQSDVPKKTKEAQHGIFKNLLDQYVFADIEGCMRWLQTWRTVPWKPESLWKEIDTWILENRPTNGRRSPPPKPLPLRSSSGVVSRADGQRQREMIGR